MFCLIDTRPFGLKQWKPDSLTFSVPNIVETQHSNMMGTVNVMSQEEFDTWLEAGSTLLMNLFPRQNVAKHLSARTDVMPATL